MASLRYSAAEKSEGTLNASHSFTGYEPNLLTFGELQNSSVPFSFMIRRLLCSMDQGNLTSEKAARAHRLGLLLDEAKTDNYRGISAKKAVITNSKQLTQKKSADSYKDNYGDRNWNFVKLINKVLQKWKNYGSCRVLLSVRSQDESSSRTRALFWNYQAEYRNCKMK